MTPPASPPPQGYALVTGGGGGIGRAVCQELAGRGWAVAAADLDAAMAEETASLIGGSAHACRLDVASPEGWKRATEGLRARWPRLDLLVNNAGVLAAGELIDSDPADIERVVGVNLTGAMLGCRSVLPWMLEGGASRPRPQRGAPLPGVINVASIFALLSPPGFAAYNASKAGLLAASEALRGELAPRGLNVTAVLPGLTRTGLFDRAAYTCPTLAGAVKTEMVSEVSPLTPQRAAREALAAASRGEACRVIGRRARRLAWLKHWLPRLVRRRVNNESRRRLPQPAAAPPQEPPRPSPPAPHAAPEEYHPRPVV